MRVRISGEWSKGHQASNVENSDVADSPHNHGNESDDEVVMVMKKLAIQFEQVQKEG